jgi:hypothetical protein
MDEGPAKNYVRWTAAGILLFIIILLLASH